MDRKRAADSYDCSVETTSIRQAVLSSETQAWCPAERRSARQKIAGDGDADVFAARCSASSSSSSLKNKGPLPSWGIRQSVCPSVRHVRLFC